MTAIATVRMQASCLRRTNFEEDLALRAKLREAAGKESAHQAAAISRELDPEFAASDILENPIGQLNSLPTQFFAQSATALVLTDSARSAFQSRGGEMPA